jgi:hypothetical protein
MTNITRIKSRRIYWAGHIKDRREMHEKFSRKTSRPRYRRKAIKMHLNMMEGCGLNSPGLGLF